MPFLPFASDLSNAVLYTVVTVSSFVYYYHSPGHREASRKSVWSAPNTSLGSIPDEVQILLAGPQPRFATMLLVLADSGA